MLIGRKTLNIRGTNTKFHTDIITYYKQKAKLILLDNFTRENIILVL